MKHLVLSAILASCTIPGCGGSGCDSVGCSPPLTIRITEPVSGPGAYEIISEQDGSTERCSFELDTEPPRGSSRDCGVFWLAFDGSGALAAIQTPRASQLSVSVLRGGEVLRTGAFSPAYENQELNGDGCGTCPFARVEL